MRMFTRLCAIVLFSAMAVGSAGSSLAATDKPAVQFTQKPTATKAADGIKIEFAVSGPTDVAVYIEVVSGDQAGKVVCHLAAGMLGKNPPPPLKADSLSQSILWDGKDDGCPGKPFTGDLKSVRVRVALGMSPQFDSFVLHNPDGSGAVIAVAVGPGGTVYAFHRDGTANGNMGGVKLKVYDRDGKHAKVLMPFPADIAPAKVAALGVFQSPEGDIIPRLHNYEQLSFYPDPILDRGRSMSETSCPAVDSKGRVYWVIKGPMLVAVDADGGIPYDKFLGPKLSVNCGDRPCLAASSDDKYVYISDTGRNCVQRVDVKDRVTAEPFVGKSGQAGTEKELLTGPRGLAVAKGLLYVADYAADRVVVFNEADRAYVGEIKVKAPDTVGVDPATGAVYVCSAAKVISPELVKFDGYKAGKELYRLPLAKSGTWAKEPVQRIAVDASGKEGSPVRIWMAGWYYSSHKLYCIEDAGEKFVDKGDPRSKELWAEGPRDLSVDRIRGEVYVKGNGQKYYRLNDTTGKLKDIINLESIPNNVNSTQLVPGSDGNLYTDTWSAGLWRLDRAGKPLKLSGEASHILGPGGIMCFQERHIALRPYAPVDEIWRVADPLKTGEPRSSVNVIGADGQVKRTGIWQCLAGAVVRLDAKGNIYLADMVKPPDRPYPAFFDGKVENPPKSLSPNGWPFWMAYVYGSIIKFPPEGGAIWYKKDVPKTAVGQPPAALLDKPKIPAMAMYNFTPYQPIELQGALWYRFGYSPYSCYYNLGASGCMCEGSGFDVDPFGRVFFPNVGQSRVEIVDTNNNPIVTFGKYGNEDSGGPDARVKKPEIPLAWPCYVAASDNYAYVADTVNRRVVRVKLNYAVEATVALP